MMTDNVMAHNEGRSVSILGLLGSPLPDRPFWL